MIVLTEVIKKNIKTKSLDTRERDYEIDSSKDNEEESDPSQFFFMIICYTNINY